MADNDHNTRVARPAHNYVPEYQQSGIPFVKRIKLTGGVDKISFPFVTRWIHLHNTSNNAMFVGFSAVALNAADDAASSAKFTLSKGERDHRLELKCKEIHVKGTLNDMFEVVAGLTNIRAIDFPDQTAANGFEGVE